MSQVKDTVERSDVLRQPRRRRWRLWLGVALILVCLWLVIIYAFFVYWMDRDLNDAMAAADRDSPRGWRLEDIDAGREKMPDEQNAALVALKVKSLLPANWPVQQSGGDADSTQRAWHERLAAVSPQVQLDDELTESLRASLATIEPARTEARKLIGMTRGRFPLLWANNIFTTIVQSQDARNATNLLGYEAALASQEGNADDALACVRGMVGSARSVGDEPLLVSTLIRFACDAQAVVALERTLAHGEPSIRELETLQALLENEAAQPSFERGVRGERACMHEIMRLVRHGDVSLTALVGAAAGGVGDTLLKLSGPTLVRRSHAYLLRLLNEYVEASQLPPEKQTPVLKNLERKVIQAKIDHDVITASLMPAVLKVAESNRRVLGNLRCAYVALALERYRRDHGDWPDSLAALVPNYLAAVPTDPQDGAPLRFKRRPDGVVVYWIGPDGIDDGGNLIRLNYPATGSDQGFQLWNLNERRQPAREMLPRPAEEEGS